MKTLAISFFLILLTCSLTGCRFHYMNEEVVKLAAADDDSEIWR